MYEYKIEEFMLRPKLSMIDEMQAFLNARAKEGWRYIDSFYNRTTLTDAKEIFLFFEREIEPPKD